MAVRKLKFHILNILTSRLTERLASVEQKLSNNVAWSSLNVIFQNMTVHVHSENR